MAVEGLKITVENLRFFLKTSSTRVKNLEKKRNLQLARVFPKNQRKEKEKRLEKSISRFKNIKPNSVFRSSTKLGDSILEVLSILLLGVAITNFEFIKDKFIELKDKVKVEYTKYKKFLTSIVDSAKSFIGFFEKRFPQVFDGDVETSDKLSKLKDELKTVSELNEELNRIANNKKFKDVDKIEIDKKEKIDTNTNNVNNDNLNSSFMNQMNFSDDFTPNFVDPNLLNLDPSVFSETKVNNIPSFNYNMDLNPKPIRSNYPNDKRGQKEFENDLKSWQNSQKTYLKFLPPDNASGDNIYIFKQPIIYK